MSKRSQWIGKEGAAFERVGLAFEAVGYTQPQPDEGQNGAYACNIVRQYAADMTDEEALAVIDYGLAHSREYLRDEKGYVSLREVVLWA